jgi:DNA-binding MarR family transcriptional regulator
VDVRQLADRLHSTAIHLLRRLRRVDESTGLSAPKLSALSVAVHSGPITLGDLAAAEQVRPPTMTRLVQELESAGLIERRSDSNDRRVVRVQATAAGKRLLKKGRSQRVALLADWLQTLEHDELAMLAGSEEILRRFAKR